MMTPDTLAQMQEHAAAEFPRECCGMIIVQKGRERYWPCRNVASEALQFQMHHEDSSAAEEAGDVLAIVHSHPNLSPQPTQNDLVGCESSGLPWIILSWPTGELRTITPTGYQAPLVGRVFSHGVLDCYTLIRDYYQRELTLTLPDFERPDQWWDTGLDLYRDHFADAGFHAIELAEVRRHDVILMQVFSTKTNHGAIYLGDGLILHHPMKRLSGRDVYGGYWQKITTHYLRHEALA